MHDHFNGHQNSGDKDKVLHLASTIAAIIICFFGFPPVFNGTVDVIQDYSIANYGFGGGFVSFLWGMIVLIGLFAVTKSVIFYGSKIFVAVVSSRV